MVIRATIRVRACARPPMLHRIDLDMRQDAQIRTASVFVFMDKVAVGIRGFVSKAETVAFRPLADEMGHGWKARFISPFSAVVGSLVRTSVKLKERNGSATG